MDLARRTWHENIKEVYKGQIRKHLRLCRDSKIEQEQDFQKSSYELLKPDPPRVAGSNYRPSKAAGVVQSRAREVLCGDLTEWDARLQSWGTRGQLLLLGIAILDLGLGDLLVSSPSFRCLRCLLYSRPNTQLP